MKYLYVFTAYLLLSTSISAQTPTFQNPFNNSSGAAASDVKSVEVDGSGNVYFAGGHSDSVNFGGTIVAPGSGGAFFGKATSAGSVLWMAQGGCPSPTSDRAFDIAIDRNGDVYFCGSVALNQIATFNGSALPAFSGGFVVKYTSGGAFLWARGYGYAIYSIAVDSNNVPFINVGDSEVYDISPADGAPSGAFGTISGNSQNPQQHNLLIDSDNNIVVQGGNKVIKFTDNLVEIWATLVTPSVVLEASRIAIDDSNNVYGAFYALFGTVTIGGITKSTFPNGYLFKLDGQTGTPLFVDSVFFGGAASKIREVVVDGAGNYYLSGDGAFNVPHVAKFDNNKATLWDKVFANTAKVSDIAFISDDCLAVGGSHRDTATFDSYRLSMPNGGSGFDNAYAVTLCAGTVDVNESYTDGVVPDAYALSQNYPNPFNPVTSISYAIPRSGMVSVRLYDIGGREVMTLVDGERNAGVYELTLDGSVLSSGVYIYTIRANDYIETRKMTLMK